jgi:hypothetical protein
MGSRETVAACPVAQHGGHAFAGFQGRTREGLYLDSRRSMLKAGMAGMAGLSLPLLLQNQQAAAAAGTCISDREAPRFESFFDARLCGIYEVTLAPRIRRVSGQTVRSFYL